MELKLNWPHKDKLNGIHVMISDNLDKCNVNVLLGGQKCIQILSVGMEIVGMEIAAQ